jgi:NAD(P)-dependent dehydrogenase (short-subunit alcohol dehydrogenase family)
MTIEENNMGHKRTSLVTDANRGIGFAIAKGLAAQGDIKVLAVTRLAEDAEIAAREIGHGVVGVALDLSNPTEVELRAKAIEADEGPIDILVNNAAVLIPGNGLEISAADLVHSLAVNTGRRR